MYDRENTSGYTDDQLALLNRALSNLAVYMPRLDEWTQQQMQTQAEQWVLEAFDDDPTRTSEQVTLAVADRFGWL